MHFPGFTAEDALRSASRQRTITPWHGPSDALVRPAIAGPDAPGLQGCIEDCMDTCAGSPAQCRTQCRARCTSRPSVGPGPGPGNPTNNALCVGACWTWWGACMLDTAFALGFGSFICNPVRDQC